MFKPSDIRPKCGVLIIISGPSGVGKSTLVQRVLSTLPNSRYSVSATTRPPRAGEIDGEDYFFISRHLFEKMVSNGEFIEWAEVHDNLYGTPYKFINDSIKQGYDVFLDIDTYGAFQIKRAMPNSVSIFVLPPSYEELESRLRKRGSETEDNIYKRMKNAIDELHALPEYDYIILNESIDDAVNKIISIREAEHLRVKRADYQGYVNEIKKRLSSICREEFNRSYTQRDVKTES